MSEPINNRDKKAKKKKFINVLLAIFAICIAIYTIIGALVVDNFSNLQQVEDLSEMEEDSYKGEIDDRLRFIAMQEDEGNPAKIDEEEATQDKNLEENNLPNEPEEIAAFLENGDVKKTKFEEYNEKYRKKQYREDGKPENTEKEVSDVPFNKDVAISPVDVTLKVVIGDFSSKEAAQNELEKVKSQFSASPFIKTVNGRYTLQVGSFKTKSTADSFVTSLKQQGYNARIIEE